MMRKVHGLVVAAITIAAIANFLTAMVLYMIHGGDATAGFERAGHFYFWNKPHTSYQEVSQAVWQLSQLTTRALPFLWVLMFLALGSWALSTASKALDGTALREADSRVRFVRRSGSLLCSRRVSGSSGRVSWSGPLFLVEVYPGGVLVRPWLIRQHAILASEIRDVVADGTFLEIHHTGAGMPSPVRLSESSEAPLGAAIRTIGQGPDAMTHPVLPTARPAKGPRFRVGIGISGQDSTSSDRGKS